jgi:hypothetical protein
VSDTFLSTIEKPSATDKLTAALEKQSEMMAALLGKLGT